MSLVKIIFLHLHLFLNLVYIVYPWWLNNYHYAIEAVVRIWQKWFLIKRANDLMKNKTPKVFFYNWFGCDFFLQFWLLTCYIIFFVLVEPAFLLE